MKGLVIFLMVIVGILVLSIIVFFTYLWQKSEPKITPMASFQSGNNKLELVAVYEWELNYPRRTLGLQWNDQLISTLGFTSVKGSTMAYQPSLLPEAMAQYKLEYICHDTISDPYDLWGVWVDPQTLNDQDFQAFKEALQSNLIKLEATTIPSSFEDKEVWQDLLEKAKKGGKLGIRFVAHYNPKSFKRLIFTKANDKEKATIEVQWNRQVQYLASTSSGTSLTIPLGFIDTSGDTLFMLRTKEEVDHYEATGKLSPIDTSSVMTKEIPADLSTFLTADGQSFTTRYRIIK